MPRKIKPLSVEKRKEAKLSARKAFTQINKDFIDTVQEAAKIIRKAHGELGEKDAYALQAMANNIPRIVVNNGAFLEKYVEWAFENPGQAMQQSIQLGAKNVQIKGEVDHKHFVMVGLEDPASWQQKVIDMTESAKSENVPWDANGNFKS